MPTYYRGPDALVTEEQFVWRTGTSRIFLVRELHHVGLVREDGVDRRADIALVATAGMIAFTVTTWMLAGWVAGLTLGFVSLIAATLAVTTRRRRSVWQVRATYRGVDVVVYASPDARVFNQVARALRRALEVNRSAHEEYRSTERDPRGTATRGLLSASNG
jgi:hypothetical protein